MFGDDPMPVVIGVAGKGHIELIFLAEQATHRIRRRRVHPDLAIVVDGHKTKGRIDKLVGYREVELVFFYDSFFFNDTATTERIYPELCRSAPDRIHVQD